MRWNLMRVELRPLRYKFLRSGGRMNNAELHVCQADELRWMEAEEERVSKIPDMFWNPEMADRPTFYCHIPILYDCPTTKFTIRVVRVWMMPTEMIFSDD